ncbi:MAG: hypothetical protein LAT67_01050 [Balneolales bacterium]|nr:hypothetical protein [Balneolales bacterium]
MLLKGLIDKKYRLISLLGCFALFVVSSLVMVACQSEKDGAATLSELMRDRTNQLQEIKDMLEAGDEMESATFIYDAFIAGVPSRDALGEPAVQGQLMAFDRFYASFLNDINRDSYTMVIQTCISCHERLCPGPLRLIRSMALEPIPEPGFTRF